jgi:hypothetical protein
MISMIDDGDIGNRARGRNTGGMGHPQLKKRRSDSAAFETGY